MHSIRTKLTALTIAAMLVSLLSIGSISIYTLKMEGDRHTEQSMNLICDNRRRTVNEYLNSVEQSVDMVTRYVSETLDIVELMTGGVIGMTGDGRGLYRDDWNSEQQLRLDAHLKEHLDMVRTVFLSVANHTNGVIAYYYRMNPEISRKEAGFLFSRIGSTQFSEFAPTEILDYTSDDISHVGWYYLPLERGRPSWLNPYYNQNLGIRMVSYVTPIYKAGTFIGVVGMDISYDTLVSQIEGIRVLDSGYVVLTDDEGRIVYHPELPVGTNLTEVLTEPVERLCMEEESGSTPIRYNYSGVWKHMYFSTLSNDMRLIVVAPEAEIRANTMRLINQIVTTSVVILILFSVLMAVSTQRLTEPLRRLTAASKRLSAGDYRVELTYRGDDEVGILTGAFQQLVEHLRIYINDLNSRAYQDALTGVKNKSAYNVSARILNDAIRMSSPKEGPEFAVIMFDCNDLKKINDHYGHEKGDIYLQTACELICRVFTHSPVFRMGGDEFTVILQKDDYYSRHDLLLLFDAQSEQINEAAEHPWEQVRIAKGLAEYNCRRDVSVETVLKRADERMYADKKRYKASRLA